jgi:hypothetical protein
MDNRDRDPFASESGQSSGGPKTGTANRKEDQAQEKQQTD